MKDFFPVNYLAKALNAKVMGLINFREFKDNFLFKEYNILLGSGSFALELKEAIEPLHLCIALEHCLESKNYELKNKPRYSPTQEIEGSEMPEQIYASGIRKGKKETVVQHIFAYPSERKGWSQIVFFVMGQKFPRKG